MKYYAVPQTFLDSVEMLYMYTHLLIKVILQVVVVFYLFIKQSHFFI